MTKRWELNRRSFLKCSMGGAATLIGLPFLEEMIGSVRRAEAAGYVDANFIALYKPMGCDRESFFPDQYAVRPELGKFTGSQWNLSATLKSLEPYKDFTNVYAGLGYGLKGFDHDEEAVKFLTGLAPRNPDYKAPAALNTGGVAGQSGKSLDQYIGDQLFGAANPMRSTRHSLQLASDFHNSNYANRNVVSFENADKPLFAEYDVQRLFDTLFFGFNPEATAVTLTDRQRRKRNVLDEVWNSDTKSLISSLSTTSKNNVQRYLASIESVRKKIDALAVPGNPLTCTKPARPGVIRGSGTPAILNEDYPKHVEIMMDLMVIALQCNMTKVVSYMFGPGQGAYRAWRSLVNVAGEPYADKINATLEQQWHDWSHFDVADAGIHRAQALVDKFHIDRVAYLASRLKEAGLLEKTLVLYGAGMGEVTLHTGYSVPCLTIGRGAGAKTNTLRVLNKFQYNDSYTASVARLHVDIAKAFGVSGIGMDNFGLHDGEDPNHAARKVTFDVFA